MGIIRFYPNENGIQVSSYIKARIVVDESSLNDISNSSYINVYVQMCRTNSGYTTYGEGTLTLTIGGTSYNHSITTSQKLKYANQWELVGGITGLSVGHTSDGSFNMLLNAKSTVNNNSMHFDFGGYVPLTTLDRAAPTVYVSTSNIKADSIDIRATASVACDIWQYSTNGGGSWTTFKTAATTDTGIYTIYGLTPNVSYVLKVRVRKQKNGVYGESGSTTIKTLGGSLWQSIDTLNIDNATVDLTFTATVYDTSYTHSIDIANGSQNLLTLTNLKLNNGSNTIKLTAAQRAQVLNRISNVKSLSATYWLNTYSESVHIGESSKKIVVIQTSAANSAPTFSDFTFSDTNTKTVEVTGNNQILVANISTLQAIASSATAKNGASISSYTATVGDKSISSSGTTLNIGAISKSGTLPLTITATDTRGYTAKKTKNIQIVPYENIKFEDSEIRRINDVENTLQISVNGSFSPVKVGTENKNSFRKMEYRFKKTSDNTYGAWTEITSSVNSTADSFNLNINEWITADSDFSFYVQLYIADKLTNAYMTFTIPQGLPLLSFRKKKVGINRHNPQSALDVGGDIMMNGYKVQGFVKTLDGTENLNDLKTGGIYIQNENQNIINNPNSNYPVKKAGYLEVLCSDNGNFLQRYTTFDCSAIYIRSWYEYDHIWYNWKKIF